MSPEAGLTRKPEAGRSSVLSDDRDALARAIRSVTEEAQWEALDLLSRRGADTAPELLRGHSAELATSPVSRDQLLSLALDQTAESILRGGESPMADLQDLRVLCPLSDAAAAAVMAEADRLVECELSLVRQYVGDLVRRAGGSASACTSLSEGLYEQARLNEACWCEARIPAQWRIRALMLASIPTLDAAARVRDRPSLLLRLLARCRR